jgi:hypothetical protein
VITKSLDFIFIDVCYLFNISSLEKKSAALTKINNDDKKKVIDQNVRTITTLEKEAVDLRKANNAMQKEIDENIMTIKASVVVIAF